MPLLWDCRVPAGCLAGWVRGKRMDRHEGKQCSPDRVLGPLGMSGAPKGTQMQIHSATDARNSRSLHIVHYPRPLGTGIRFKDTTPRKSNRGRAAL